MEWTEVNDDFEFRKAVEELKPKVVLLEVVETTGFFRGLLKKVHLSFMTSNELEHKIMLELKPRYRDDEFPYEELHKILNFLIEKEVAIINV